MEIHAPFVRGDLEGLERAVGDPRGFPATAPSPGLGEPCLEYATAPSRSACIRRRVDRERQGEAR